MGDRKIDKTENVQKQLPGANGNLANNNAADKAADKKEATNNASEAKPAATTTKAEDLDVRLAQSESLLSAAQQQVAEVNDQLKATEDLYDKEHAMVLQLNKQLDSIEEEGDAPMPASDAMAEVAVRLIGRERELSHTNEQLRQELTETHQSNIERLESYKEQVAEEQKAYEQRIDQLISLTGRQAEKLDSTEKECEALRKFGEQLVVSVREQNPYQSKIPEYLSKYSSMSIGELKPQLNERESKFEPKLYDKFDLDIDRPLPRSSSEDAPMSLKGLKPQLIERESKFEPELYDKFDEQVYPPQLEKKASSI